MKLMTQEITTLAQQQYCLGSDMDQLIVAKFFDHQGSWSWYLMNQDPEDPDYLWGIVRGFEIEMGSFSLSELSEYRGKLGLGIERDIGFRPMAAKELWEKLNRGQHV
jgi:hypothetical protein